MKRQLLVSICTLLLVTACGSSSSPNGSGSTATGGGANSASGYYGGNLPAPGGPTQALQVGCDWFKVYDQNVDANQGNTAFPDTHAVYWVALGPSQPTADESLQIAGRYPAVRYFSLQAYDQNVQLADKLIDYQFQPDSGDSNPFIAPTVIDPAISSGGHYSAALAFETAPTQRAPNTLYRGKVSALAQKPNTSILLYRTYLPAGGPNDPTGGVGLPKLTLHSASGDTELSKSPDAASCRQLAADFLKSSANTQTIPILAAPSNPPKFRLYNGVLGGAAGQGTATNADTGFLYARTSLTLGNLLLIRGRAPSFAQQSNAPSVPDVRYWSFCQNDYNTQHVISCAADRDAPLDSSGFYTVVVSTPDQRPSNATSGNGFAWITRGTQDASILIYRNLLASTSFSEAVQNVGPLQSPATVMGDYYPLATFCSKAAFEAAAGQTPAQIFAACQADSQALGGGILSGLGSVLNPASGSSTGTGN